METPDFSKFKAMYENLEQKYSTFVKSEKFYVNRYQDFIKSLQGMGIVSKQHPSQIKQSQQANCNLFNKYSMMREVIQQFTNINQANEIYNNDEIREEYIKNLDFYQAMLNTCGKVYDVHTWATHKMPLQLEFLKSVQQQQQQEKELNEQKKELNQQLENQKQISNKKFKEIEDKLYNQEKINEDLQQQINYLTKLYKNEK